MADSGAGGGGGGKGGDGGGKGARGGDGNDEKLAQFIAVTGVSSEDVANHWLEANAYSLENAVSMFMDSGAGGGTGGGGGGSGGAGEAAGGGAALSTPAFPSKAGGPQPGDSDYVRPADPYKRQRLVEDPRSHGGHPYGGMATAARWSGAAAQGHIPFRDFQEEHRQAALASNPFASAAKGKRPSDPAAAEKQKKLASIFSPPTDIMFMGDFQAARQAAKQQKKWLLVNIQTEAEFDCHRLNRDVWKDEMIQNIIECNCIFWQQPSISEEAKLYCRRYNATGFPHIALIDPRTGMRVWNFQGFLAPPEFIEKVTDVTDKISFEDGAPERLPPPPPRQPQLPPSTGGSEDQMLAAAIAASLDAGNGGGSDSGSSSGGGADAKVMAAPPTSSGGGSGAPVATVAGGPISVDDSDEEEEEEEEEEEDDAIFAATRGRKR
ncbi:unnamed protein product [Ectocarpus sp. CCAP 1310/34]|nr:unnamed protein product [Ectocarpus sp. CCAP 1310/34]